jgi:putative transposase
MTIVPIGSLVLQVSPREHSEFVPELCSVIQRQILYAVGRCLEEVLETELEGQLGRGRYRRRRHCKGQEIERRCSRCGSHQRQGFRRNGHYARHLDTHWGRVVLGVPQVQCVCGGNVRMSFRMLHSGQRVWDDLAVEIGVEYHRGLSYRQIKLDLDQRLGSSVGLRTLNQCVLQAVPEGIPGKPFALGEVPPVVRLDGIWITVMFPTGQTQRDRLGRLRTVKRAKKVPILAAQGVGPLTGKTTLLTWIRAESEDEMSWQKFLEHLYLAGLTPENGLALLVADGSKGFRAAYENIYWTTPLQRCVFHKLQNMSQALRTPPDLDRQAAHAYRTRFLHSAAQLWQAPDETEARQRYVAFCQEWQSIQPKAIATLSRDLEETLAFYAIQEQAAAWGQDWPAHLLRTTSPLERTFREFRRRYRNAVLFYSEQGAKTVTAHLAARFS